MENATDEYHQAVSFNWRQCWQQIVHYDVGCVSVPSVFTNAPVFSLSHNRRAFCWWWTTTVTTQWSVWSACGQWLL